MRPKAKVRVVGVIALVPSAPGVEYFLAYFRNPITDSWYNVYVFLLGAIGVLGLQFIFFPGKVSSRIKRRIPKRAAPRALSAFANVSESFSRWL